jgi:FMN reductase
MSTIVTLNGSPSADSRTGSILSWVAHRLARGGHRVESIDVRDLPSEDLIFACSTSPSLAGSLAAIQQARGIVIGTPIYKACFTGLLKTFLDLLPPFGLGNKTVLPLATGGTPAHALALDYSLRPVLASLGAFRVEGSFFVLDKMIQRSQDGDIEIEPDTSRKLDEAIATFSDSIKRHE